MRGGSAGVPRVPRVPRGVPRQGFRGGGSAEGCKEGVGEGVVKLLDPKLDRFRRRVALFQAPLFS